MKKNKFEGSKKDMAEDRAMAKKSGMSLAKWERSAADKKHDTKKKMALGGKATMDKMGRPMTGVRNDKFRPMDAPPKGRPMDGVRNDKFRPMDAPPKGRPMDAEMDAPRVPPSNPIGRPMANPPAVGMPAAGGAMGGIGDGRMYRTMKKGGAVKKMAKGGMVKGSGCAVRGVKKAKSY